MLGGGVRNLEGAWEEVEVNGQADGHWELSHHTHKPHGSRGMKSLSKCCFDCVDDFAMSW